MPPCFYSNPPQNKSPPGNVRLSPVKMAELPLLFRNIELQILDKSLDPCPYNQNSLSGNSCQDAIFLFCSGCKKTQICYNIDTEELCQRLIPCALKRTKLWYDIDTEELCQEKSIPSKRLTICRNEESHGKRIDKMPHVRHQTENDGRKTDL